MATLHWDCETRSTVDLRKCGVYVYAAHPTTEVLMIGFALDRGDVWWFEPGDGSRAELLFLDALRNADTVAAHNAGFERRMLTDILGPRFGYPQVPLERWDCTAARAAIQALPRSLDGALKALGAPVQKDKKGHALMLQMCKPRRVWPKADKCEWHRARNAALAGDRAFSLDGERVIEWWWDDARRDRLAAYMCDDVRGERELDRILAPFRPEQHETWRLIEGLNDHGVPADLSFINAARWLAYDAAADLDRRIAKLTGGVVKRASNVKALKGWLEFSFGIDCGLVEPDNENAEAGAAPDSPEDDAPPVKLDKRRILDLLADPEVPEIAKEALRIRQQAGKTSVQKYDAMLARASADGWIRGNLVFHGASTGRLAGAGVQMQNMIRDVRKDWEAVRADMLELDLAEFEAKHGPAMTALSQMIRGFLFVPAHFSGELWWADYAAVEARGVAWLSGCTALTTLFATGGKVYEAMAHAIYPDLSEAEITRRDKAGEGIERFVGKQVVLGCGYGMGPPKFVGHCDNFNVPVSDETARHAVYTYRETYPEIPALWREMENAARSAIQNPGQVFRAGLNGCIAFRKEGAWLKMRLPSGRILWYCRARIEERQSKHGIKSTIVYDAVNSMTKKWGPETTWGGKLTENAVQALCFDLIDAAKKRLKAAGYGVLLSVHDEIIALLSDKRIAEGASVDEMLSLMCQLPEWAGGFPLKAEAKTGRRYAK